MLPTTSSMLLDALRDPANAPVWGEFDGRYRPVLVAFARRLGLGDDDAQDVAQATLAAFVQAFREGQYERDRGRLRSWLFTIARNRVVELWRRADRGGTPRGDSVLETIPDEKGLSAAWEDQWRRALIREGLRQLRSETRMDERTLAAFEQVTLEERPPAEVARALGLTVESVYVAKSRALQRLQAILERLERDW